MWNVEKLKKERADLVEVISSLRKWQRFAIDEHDIIPGQITAHMMRLSALDDELTTLAIDQQHQASHV